MCCRGCGWWSGLVKLGVVFSFGCSRGIHGVDVHEGKRLNTRKKGTAHRVYENSKANGSLCGAMWNSQEVFWRYEPRRGKKEAPRPRTHLSVSLTINIGTISRVPPSHRSIESSFKLTTAPRPFVFPARTLTVPSLRTLLIRVISHIHFWRGGNLTITRWFFGYDLI